jgi:hypothetical protein
MTAKHGQVEEMFDELGPVRTRATATGHVANATKLSTPATYNDRTSLETYLLGQGYTQAQLNNMLLNDLVYAAKLKQDAGII